jgi:PAS domain S-box-containing protein
MVSLAAGKTTHRLRELTDGRTIRITNRPLPDGGWVATHEDITEQRKAEVELQDTRNFLTTVIDHVPAAILVKDSQEMRYVLINRTGEKFVGLPAHDIIGKSAHEFLAKEAADAILARDKALLETGYLRFDDEQPLHADSGGVHHVTTERVIVPGADGRPKSF